MAQMTLYIIYKCFSSKVEHEQYSTSQETSKDSKLNPKDRTFQDNQQIELKVVYNTEEMHTN